jgi:hypothetical protein
VAASTPTIPRPFHGRWNPTLAACSPNNEGLEEIRISAHSLNHYEWHHTPVAVAGISAGRLRVSAWLYDPGAGTAQPEQPIARETLQLALLDGGRRLSYQANKQPPRIFVRCVGPRPQPSRKAN